MITLKKVSILTMLFFSAFLLQFCDNDCGKKKFNKTTIENYTFLHTNNSDFSIVAGDSINMSNGDSIHLSFEVYARYSQRLQTSDLFACDPVLPVFEPRGDSLKIICLDKFDAAHPAGSDVGEFFRLADRTAYINGVPAVTYFPTDRFDVFKERVSILYLTLIQKPDPGNIRFKVFVYRQSTSDGISAETRSLSFY